MSTNKRIPVRKTPKLFIGGAFVRSESGRSFQQTDAPSPAFFAASTASRASLREPRGTLTVPGSASFSPADFTCR